MLKEPSYDTSTKQFKVASFGGTKDILGATALLARFGGPGSCRKPLSKAKHSMGAVDAAGKRLGKSSMVGWIWLASQTYLLK